MTVTSDDVARYLGHLESADRSNALQLALELGARASPEDLITDLLGPAQIEVGRRWQSNEWDVGREYAATSITDYVLAALSSRWAADVRTGYQVALLCAEGESHALPARMAAELLRLRGWPVTMLGASLPAQYLEAYLREQPVLAAAVSCTLPRSLPGARRLVESAHASGVPVLAGGGALDEQRATRIGADAWAGSAQDAAQVLEQWAATPPAELRAPAEPSTEYWVLSSELTELAGEVLGGTIRRLPEIARRDNSSAARLREEVGLLLEFLAASVLMEDVTIVVDFLRWQRMVLVARGEPAAVTTAMLESLSEALDVDRPMARLALRAGGQALGM